MLKFGDRIGHGGVGRGLGGGGRHGRRQGGRHCGQHGGRQGGQHGGPTYKTRKQVADMELDMVSDMETRWPTIKKILKISTQSMR